MNDSTRNAEEPLASVGASPGQAVPGEAAAQASALPALSPQQVEQRYIEAANALLDDAIERSAVRVLADVLAWKLAVIGYHHGPGATGDVVQKLGFHLVKLDEVARAQQEAEQAAKEGRSAN
jgi:hypothetical protein